MLFRSRRRSLEPASPHTPLPVRRSKTQFGIGVDDTESPDSASSEEGDSSPSSLCTSPPSSFAGDSIKSATSHPAYEHSCPAPLPIFATPAWPYLSTSGVNPFPQPPPSPTRRPSLLRRMSSTSLRRPPSQDGAIAPPLLGVIVRKPSLVISELPPSETEQMVIDAEAESEWWRAAGSTVLKVSSTPWSRPKRRLLKSFHSQVTNPDSSVVILEGGTNSRRPRDATTAMAGAPRARV